jgi:hypothetical protein
MQQFVGCSLKWFYCCAMDECARTAAMHACELRNQVMALLVASNSALGGMIREAYLLSDLGLSIGLHYAQGFAK